MNLQDIEKAIRTVPDFPKKGINFKDITTAIKQPHIFHEIIENMAQQFHAQKIDAVVGVESRGFIIGAALAYALGCGFVPVRKPGKLPASCLYEEYGLEYGTDRLEIHTDSLLAQQRVLIIDDLLATGGTALAAASLVQKLQAQIVSFAFLVEISHLGGRAKLESIASVYSLIECCD